MDKNASYDGPTLAVLVREHSTMFGPIAIDVVSVHRDRADAAGALAEQILAGLTTGQGLAVFEVPAPFLAGPSEIIRAAAKSEREGAHLGRMLAERQAAGDLAAALDLDEAGDWTTMCRKVRGLRQAQDELDPFVLADLRDILRSTQDDPMAVDRMAPSALLDIVRSLVVAAGTPGAMRRAELVRELDPAASANAERLKDAARVVAGGQRNAPMQWTELAARVVTAYLQGED